MWQSIGSSWISWIFLLHPEKLRAATLDSVLLLVFTILSFQSLCKAYYHRWGLECWLTGKHRALSFGSVLQMLGSATVCIFNRVFTLKFIFSRTGVETFRQVLLLVVNMLLLSFVILRSHFSFWLNHSLCWLHTELQNLFKYKTIWAVAFHDCVVICVLLWHTETDVMCSFIYLSPCSAWCTRNYIIVMNPTWSADVQGLPRNWI